MGLNDQRLFAFIILLVSAVGIFGAISAEKVTLAPVPQDTPTTTENTQNLVIILIIIFVISLVLLVLNMLKLTKNY